MPVPGSLLTNSRVSTVQYSAVNAEQVDMEEPRLFDSSSWFTLGFEIVFITKEFTRFQMIWHYSWAFIALIFMFVPKIGFFYEMMQLHQNFWSRQQVRYSPGAKCISGAWGTCST